MAPNISILHVDDDAMDRELVRLQIARHDRSIVVEEAACAEEAIKRIEGNGSFDCILCDYQMPGMSGLDLLSILMERDFDIPFIFLTGQGNEQVAAQALRYGADDYFTKHEGFAQYQRIVNTIQRLARGRRERLELKSTRRRLQFSEQQFKSVFSNAAVGMVLLKEDGTILMANDGMYAFLAYELGELVGIQFFRIFHEEDVPAIRESFQRLLAGEVNGYTAERRLVRKDGRDTWGRVSVSMVTDEHEGSKVAVAIYEDINAHKATENALTRSEELFRSMFERSRDAIFIADDDAVFVRVNAAACTLTGYSENELIGMRIPDLHDGVDLVAFNTFFKRILDGEEVLSRALIRRKDGSKVDTEFSNSRIRLADVYHLLTIARDVSGRQEA
jgi:PAS domain S-box-containing protein